MRANAVERIFAVGLFQERSHPSGALIDAGLELRGDRAGAACGLVVAVAWARGADFGADGAFEVVDGAL